MDKKTLDRVLKGAKDRLEAENTLFIRSLQKRAKHETEFISAIETLSKSADSMYDVIKLNEKLQSHATNTQMIKDTKKDIKSAGDLRMKLEKLRNLSNKRTQQLNEISTNFKCMFDTEMPDEVVEIPDSPEQFIDDTDDSPQSIDKNTIQPFAKVRMFTFISMKEHNVKILDDGIKN